MSTSGPEPQPDVLRWIENFAAHMLNDELLRDLYTELVAELTVEIPETAADAGIRRDLDASTRDLLNTFLAQAAKDPTADVIFPQAAVDLARTLARRRHDVGLLLRLYRVGQRLFWSKLMELVRSQVADPDLRMAVLQYLWDRMSRVLEENIDILVAAHTEESEQRLRGALMRRQETAHALLRGEVQDIDAASERLGHNLHRRQLGLVLWSEADELSESLESLAIEIATVLGSVRPLTVRAGARVLWVWVAVGKDTELARIAGAPLLRESRALRVAAGSPVPGIAGFVGSHREALRAQEVAVNSARVGQVVYYADVEVISCLSADTEAVRGLVARELGGLAGRGASLSRLRETVLAYLSVGASSRAAADLLGLHKNTVLYRLKRAEELLGHGVEERRLPLELALMVVDVYGEGVFGQEESGS